MAHIIIECSANLDARTDLAGLVRCVHAAALGTGVFPEGGLRTRLVESRYYAIADGDSANGFVHVALRIGSGRDAATKRRCAESVFDALCAYLAATAEATPLGISLELAEIDPTFSFKRNNLHDYVRLRKTTAC